MKTHTCRTNGDELSVIDQTFLFAFNFGVKNETENLIVTFPFLSDIGKTMKLKSIFIESILVLHFS